MTDVCTAYPFALAAQDVVPIVFAGAGYYYLTQRIDASIPEAGSATKAASIILVVGSIVAGPGRKVLVTLSDGSECYPSLQLPFFAALAPGFAILTWGAVSVIKGRKVNFWPYLGLLVVGVAAAVGTEKRVLLLATGGTWAVALAVSAGLIAKRSGDLPAMALYAVNAVGTLALPVIGGKDDVSSLKYQWLAQGINTVSQAAFGYASYRLLSAFRRQDKSSTVEIAT